jgi:hypothetical protein
MDVVVLDAGAVAQKMAGVAMADRYALPVLRGQQIKE